MPATQRSLAEVHGFSGVFFRASKMTSSVFETAEIVVQRGPFRIVRWQNASSDVKRAAIKTVRACVTSNVLGKDSTTVQQRHHLWTVFSEVSQNLAFGAYDVLFGLGIVPTRSGQIAKVQCVADSSGGVRDTVISQGSLRAGSDCG